MNEARAFGLKDKKPYNKKDGGKKTQNFVPIFSLVWMVFLN